jgi:hypothetical protein
MRRVAPADERFDFWSLEPSGILWTGFAAFRSLERTIAPQAHPVRILICVPGLDAQPHEAARWRSYPDHAQRVHVARICHACLDVNGLACRDECDLEAHENQLRFPDAKRIATPVSTAQRASSQRRWRAEGVDQGELAVGVDGVHMIDMPNHVSNRDSHRQFRVVVFVDSVFPFLGGEPEAGTPART